MSSVIIFGSAGCLVAGALLIGGCGGTRTPPPPQATVPGKWIEGFPVKKIRPMERCYAEFTALISSDLGSAYLDGNSLISRNAPDNKSISYLSIQRDEQGLWYVTVYNMQLLKTTKDINDRMIPIHGIIFLDRAEKLGDEPVSLCKSNDQRK